MLFWKRKFGDSFGVCPLDFGRKVWITSRIFKETDERGFCLIYTMEISKKRLVAQTIKYLIRTYKNSNCYLKEK